MIAKHIYKCDIYIHIFTKTGQEFINFKVYHDIHGKNSVTAIFFVVRDHMIWPVNHHRNDRPPHTNSLLFRSLHKVKPSIHIRCYMIRVLSKR